MRAQIIIKSKEIGNKEIEIDAVEFDAFLLGRKIKNYLKRMQCGDSITICPLDPTPQNE